MEWKIETIQHLRNHVQPILPIEGADIIELCHNMEDIPKKDRELIETRLILKKDYRTLDDILVDINTER